MPSNLSRIAPCREENGIVADYNSIKKDVEGGEWDNGSGGRTLSQSIDGSEGVEEHELRENGLP